MRDGLLLSKLASHVFLTVVQLIFFLRKAELFEPLLFRSGLIHEGARLFIRPAPSATDDSVDTAVQDIEAFLDF